MQAMKSEYITIAEMAKALGESRVSVYKKIQRGIIPGITKSGSRKGIGIGKVDFEKWMRNNEDYLTPAGVAKRLGQTRFTVYRKIKSGKIPGVFKLPSPKNERNPIRINEKIFNEWMEERGEKRDA